jgi:hypothetical protein
MFTSPSGRLQPVWSFLLSVTFSVAAFVACSFIAALFAGEHVLRFEAIFRPLLAGALFGIYFWLLTVADQVEEQRVASLGFPVVRGWKRQLGAGCILGLILASLAVIPVIVWADSRVDIHVNSRSLLRAVIVVIILIFGALAEEMMFRGYPFQRLEEGIGALGAIAVFSVLFGLVHLSNPGASLLGLLNTVLIGLVLAIAYLRTRALWLCWGIHFGWNAALGLLFGLPVSGLRIFNVVVRGSATGPRWLTGGSYGVEASAPGIFAIAVGLLVVWKWPMAHLGKPLTFPSSEAEHLDSVAGIQN